MQQPFSIFWVQEFLVSLYLELHAGTNFNAAAFLGEPYRDW